jgi:hypothetical protein
MKELVVILSHADTTDKVDVLKECLVEIKKQNYPVLISSHIEIPNEVKNEIDYFVYDKENPLIYHWEYPNLSHVYIWQTYPGYSQTYAVEYNHSYAVLRLIKNALGVALVNGYEKVHFVNYDYVLYDSYILQNHSNKLNDYDLFSYYYDKFEQNREHINTGLFSARTEPLFNIFKNVNSKEDFLRSNQGVFEKYMYYETINNGLTMDREDQEILLATHNHMNSKSTLKNVIDDKIHVYLTKENNTDNYYLYINSTKGDVINAELTFNGELRNWKPIPYKVNLLRLANDKLSSGIKLYIPEYDFTDYYNLESHPAKCDISDPSLIQEFEDCESINRNEDLNEKSVLLNTTELEIKSFKELSELYGTDKVTYHGYHFFYPKFLESLRNDEFNMLEIGWGSGSSVKVWNDYFPKSNIFVMDIDIEYVDGRQKVIKGDQSKQEDLIRIKEEIKSAKFIIDDGSHNPIHQFNTFTYLFKNLLEPGGIYIIEDIELSYWNPESSLYGYESGYFNLVNGFKSFQEMINSEFTGVSNFLDISTINYGQNCIIITKRTDEEKSYFERSYRFSNCISNINHHG